MVRHVTLCPKLTRGVKPICTLELDLKDLPASAFTLCEGPKGDFYEVVFDLALIFGPVVTFQFMHRDIVIQNQRVEYVTKNG